jgi:predicted ATP-grasp superfamily ATP-dependent carboligase
VLRWDGRTIAVFAHRRLREKPPAGGVSVYRESIAPDPALAAAGCRLLDALDWQGVAMVECKRDAVTGRHVFMELNGRLWGSLQLAIDAGVDFPALLVASALGREVAPVTDYRVGVRSRWFWGDVDQLLSRVRRSPRALHLAAGDGSRLLAVRDFFRLHRGLDREEVWRWRDPGPFILETLQWFGLPR